MGVNPTVDNLVCFSHDALLLGDRLTCDPGPGVRLDRPLVEKLKAPIRSHPPRVTGVTPQAGNGPTDR